MGQCRYQYNPSEQYQRTKPGMAPETICGARTYPAVDEPEVVVVHNPLTQTMDSQRTGRYIARGYDDPFCPQHGGTEEPPPPPVTMPELEAAFQNYHALANRFTGAVPAEVATPAELYQQATGQQPVALENGGDNAQQQ